MPAVAGDWTPLLKGLKQDCNYGEEIYQLLNKEKNIPKNLKADVIKHDTIYKRYDNDKVVSKKYCDQHEATCYSKTTLTLKNATAFGQPIQEIYKVTGWEDSEFGLKFSNKDFAKILPSFSFNAQEYNEMKSYKIKGGDLLLVVYDMENERTLELPYQDINKYSNENRYTKIIQSSPNGVKYEGFYFDVNRKGRTLACGSYV